MRQKSLEIRRSIIEMENPYPKDDFIKDYRDFLNVREFLGHYQYNPKVFQALLNLTLGLWDSKLRISRFSLLEMICRYQKKNQLKNPIEYSTKYPPITPLTDEEKSKIFVLFKNCLSSKQYFSEQQLVEARKKCNFLLVGLELEDEEVRWLCDAAEWSEMALNRALRYPVRSKIISKWAKDHYENDKFRNRRAELTGWILDEKPDFVVDKHTLTDDFEYFNLKDLYAIQTYKEEIGMHNLVESHLDDISPIKEPPSIIAGGHDMTPKKILNSVPILELTRRFYKVPLVYSDYEIEMYPDFETMRNNFYANIRTTIKVTMLWSIKYSRLDPSVKMELMKQYYGEEVYHTFFKLCRNQDMVALLKWLLKKVELPKAEILKLF